MNKADSAEDRMAKGMKGMDEFVWVLAAAVVLLIIFALAGMYMGGPGAGPAPPATNYTLLGNFSLGRVGFTGSSPIRTLDIGPFIAGEPQIEGLKGISELGVATSLLGMEKREYTIGIEEEILSEVREVKISFYVDETNLYGNLVVKWNGMEVFNRKAPAGHYALTLEKDAIKTANSLEIYAEGPGLLFWASTAYNLREFRVNRVSGLAKLYPFSLSSGELQVFDRGEISFELGKRSPGKLLIEVNGIDIYNKEPSLAESVSFTYSDVPFLKAGSNMIAFSTETGSFNIEDAKLSIYSLTNIQVRKRGFEIDSDMLGDFAKGILEIRVERIVKEGELQVSINGQELAAPEIREGLNLIIFGEGLLQEGRNDIEFSGSGAFEIPEARIGYEK